MAHVAIINGTTMFQFTTANRTKTTGTTITLARTVTITIPMRRTAILPYAPLRWLAYRDNNK